MNKKIDVFDRRHRYRRGQVLPLVALSMAAILGMAALVFDVGIIYYSYSELQASTQAATLAGAEAMSLPGATVASTSAAVTTYSGVAGNKNAYANLPGVSIATGYPKLTCLSTLVTLFGIQCVAPSGSNALTVEQQVTIPTTFAHIFGTSSLTLTATATAGMRGASQSPFNVAIIVDSTASMNDTDSSSDCNSTRISCALAGVQVLLQNLSPCAANLTSCGPASNGNVANSVDRVSLLTFPAMTTATAAYDYNCGGSILTAPYATPFPLLTSTYQVVNFSSDYRSSDTATSLNSGSNIVDAVGYGTTSGCLLAPGGQGTYYAQVIYAAQQYLVTEQASYPNSKNVIILLSDGNASAACTISIAGVCTLGPMLGAATTGSGAYISTLDQCQQAVTAAQTAAAAGTRVYAVAYGAEASGCATDTSGITPCQTMQQIASAPAYFFSDYNATGGVSTCIAASQPATSLNQIFQTIAGDLTVARLFPNNTP